MLHAGTYSKRYHLILIPQPHHRFSSLKASHFNSVQNNVTKRHSFDSKPSHCVQKNVSVVDNIEDYNLATKNWGSKAYNSKGSKVEN
jgi:hypothetical protein